MIYAIIQARMNSTRLPGKVMMTIDKDPMLFHVIKQTLASRLIDDVIIATTNSSSDKIIRNYCKKNGFNYFVGSSNDVLDRYYQCAKKFHCDPVVRISADSPLIDPMIIDRVLSRFLNNSYDFVSNNIEKINDYWSHSTCNFPIGTVVEVCSFNCLKQVWKNSKLKSEREHVFPYVQFNPEIFNISNIKNKNDLSYIRCTVDKKQDLKFVQEIWKRKPKLKKILHINDILNIIKNENDLVKINNDISFDEGFQKSLKNDIRQNM